MSLQEVFSRKVGADDIEFGSGSFTYTDANGVTHTMQRVNTSHIPFSDGTGSYEDMPLRPGDWYRPSTHTQAALEALITAIGSTDVGIMLPPGNWPIASNVTIPSNITIRPLQGAVFTIATGATLTINGPLDAHIQHIFSCTGTGKVVFGRPAGVRELMPQWWGAVADGATNDVVAIQAMADCAYDSGGIPMFLPPGTYVIEDTIKLSKGVYYSGLDFRGAGSAGISTPFNTTIDASSLTDVPAINVQGARGTSLSDFYLLGGNIAPVTACSPSTTPSPTEADWLTAGCVDQQHSPLCGIAIDAYYGAAPADPYPNDSYGSTVSSDRVMLRNVKVSCFVVGLMVAPHGAADQDSSHVSLYDCALNYNKYAFSCGGSQARSIQFFNTDAVGNWKVITTVAHGNQWGNCPSIQGGTWYANWQLFDLGATNGNNAKNINSAHFETLGWLGNFGTTDAGSSEPSLFAGCTFANISLYEPFFFVAFSPMKFDACRISMYTTLGDRYVFNWYTAGHKTVYSSCKFTYFKDSPNVFMGMRDGITFEDTEFHGCEVEMAGYTSSGYYLNINTDFKANSSYAVRRFITPYTDKVQLLTADGTNGNRFEPYKVAFPYPYTYRTYYTLGFADEDTTGTGHSMVLTFTATSAADWKVGDIIIWQVTDRSGSNTVLMPAFRVSAIDGTDVTANSLMDGVVPHPTYTPTYINVAIPLFINATQSVGTTDGTTTVTGVTEAANWRVGDWLWGPHLAYDTRLTYVGTSTLTLSKAATSSATGSGLFNCKITGY